MAPPPALPTSGAAAEGGRKEQQHRPLPPHPPAPGQPRGWCWPREPGPDAALRYVRAARLPPRPGPGVRPLSPGLAPPAPPQSRPPFLTPAVPPRLLRRPRPARPRGPGEGMGGPCWPPGTTPLAQQGRTPTAGAQRSPLSPAEGPPGSGGGVAGQGAPRCLRFQRSCSNPGALLPFPVNKYSTPPSLAYPVSCSGKALLSPCG